MPEVGPDDDLAVRLFNGRHELCDPVVLQGHNLLVVQRNVTTDDLLQPHDLGQGIRGGRHPLVKGGKRHQDHLVIRSFLLWRELHFPAQEGLLWQIKALVFAHTERKLGKLLMQLIKPAVAHHLLKRVGANTALHGHRITGQEGVVTRQPQAIV